MTLLKIIISFNIYYFDIPLYEKRRSIKILEQFNLCVESQVVSESPKRSNSTISSELPDEVYNIYGEHSEYEEYENRYQAYQKNSAA